MCIAWAVPRCLHAASAAAPPDPTKAAHDKAAQDITIAQRMAIAKDDLKAEATDACLPGGPARDPDQRPMQKVETAQGLRQHCITSASSRSALDARHRAPGLILFDTLNNPQEAEEVLVPGLKQLGLDPANIKYRLVARARRSLRRRAILPGALQHAA